MSNISLIPAIFGNLIGGFIFDIVGRKSTIFILLILYGASFLVYPFTAPNIGWFVVFHTINSFVSWPLLVNPLI